MILLIDNYDSFSYNLYQMIGAIEPDIRVIRNDAFTVEQILDMRPSGIILSPGPGRPEDAGVCIGLIKRIGQVHDKCRIDTASRVFSGLEAVEQVGRYHSLAAVEETMPDCLKITARTEDDEIMAVEHTRYPVFGIQFHPESILTPHGNRILENFVTLSKGKGEGT